VFVDVKTERSENELPLDPILVRALKEHRRPQREERMARGAGRPGDGDLIFTTEAGKAIDPRRDHEEWERVLVQAGLPDAKPHAARHTAATLLVAAGTDISVAQEVLGHTDIRTTRGYTDVAAELKRQAVERYANLLFGGALDALVQQPGATAQARR
jgi:integrase